MGETLMRDKMQNLDEFIEQQKKVFIEKLQHYKCTGLIAWDDASWPYGQKGVAWLREGNNHGLRFNRIDTMKGGNAQIIDQKYSDFMRAVIVCETFRKNKIPSGASLEKRLNILRRWYNELVAITGQTHPMYINADIIYAAMKKHKEHSSSLSNVSDYCDLAVGLTQIIRPLNITITSIECVNKYPFRNSTANTKQRMVAEINGDHTDDTKLISIRVFLCIVEMIFLAKTDSEKIFINLMMLLIITGFRFQEAQSLTVNSLIKRDITDEDKLNHAIKNNLPTYNLGIKYLGAKRSGWRTYWLAPSTINLVESIYQATINLTSLYRENLTRYRSSSFTDFLPSFIKSSCNDLIEVSELEGCIFSGSGGTRGMGGLRKSMLSSMMNNSVGIAPVKINTITSVKKEFYFTKEQINNFVKIRYEKEKAFDDGFQCTLVLKENGKINKFKYEDLLFIIPLGSFGMERDLTVLSNPVPMDIQLIRAWLGSSPRRKSFFDKLGMTEDDGSRISIGTHVPRHNINTFLAIAGVTDHLQAMLMGRVDITQNKHYQHLAESQSYKAASLASMMLADKNKEPTPPLPNFINPLNNIEGKTSQTSDDKSRSKHLANLVRSLPVSGVDAVKKYGVIAINPDKGIEDNLKTNMHTIGESRNEVSQHIQNNMSSTFFPELKEAHRKLIADKKDELAKELIRRHAKLHSLNFGSCTRDVASWGCPFAMKCQSGLPCGYFTLTGRLDELEKVKNLLESKRNVVQQLETLCVEDSTFELALKEQREALLVLDGLSNQVFVSLKDKRLVSLLSTDSTNPLSNVVRGIMQQDVIGKIPKTLADLFFIEQKRKERDAKVENSEDE